MTQLGNLHKIIWRFAYQLYVLLFKICLYNFPFFTNHSYFLVEIRFQNDALHGSLDYENLLKVP